MSVSHHGAFPEPRDPGQEEIIKRLMDQFKGKAKREYSQGRIAPDDDGDFAYGIAADPQNKRVIIRFGQPTEWIGMDAKQAVQLAEMLIKKAREITAEPLTVNI